MAELLVGRQPIFDRSLNVIAYELLFRTPGLREQAKSADGDQMTSDVILNTFSQIGLDNIVGNSTATINVSHNFLTGKYPIPFPPNRVILEVKADTPVDAPLLGALVDLNNKGYWVALDGVVSVEKITPLLPLVKVVKIDMKNVERRNLFAMVYDLRQHSLQLVGEKVETQEDYNICYHLGLDLFQGYFLCKPSIVKGKGVESSRLVVLQSLAKLQDPKVNFELMESAIAQDVTLVYKILKVVNSGYYALPRKVDSIRQAISLMGLGQLRSWMTLLLMAADNTKPHELTTISLQRARMCELFARAKNYQQPETYFMVGVLSVLDALLDISMEEVVKSVPLAPEVAEGLLSYSGRHGEILRVVIAFEEGDWETVETLKLSADVIQPIFLDAIHWAKVLTAQLKMM